LKRNIGLAALTVLELPHEELVSVAAQAGYSHVGLRLIPVAGQPHQHPLDVAAVEKRLADTGVRVLDVEVFRLSPETRVGEFESTLALSARLKASELLVHGADPDESRLIDNFGSLCDLAARYGLNANLEPMPWVEVSNVAKGMRVISAAGKKNGALLLDAIHFFRAGDSLAELAKLPRTAFRYAQLCDAPAQRPTDMQELIRQARGDRLPPGEGGLDLAGLIESLPQDIPVSLEVPMARSLSPLEKAMLVYQSALKVLR
jgi:sugar phosphate isomerase/epimerase